MANTDSQNESIYAGKDDAAGTTTNHATYLTGSGDLSGTAKVETVVSGTAKQISTKRDAMVYVNITTSAALKVEMGPTSSVAVTVSASQSSALGVISFRVPAGWYIKCTGTVTNYTVTSVLI